MIAITDWFSPVRWSGIVAYGLAAVSCISAWLQVKSRGHFFRLAAVLGSVEILLLLDTAMNWRWLLHRYFSNLASEHNLYASRHGPQEVTMVVLSGLLLAAFGQVLQLFRGRIAAIAAVWGLCCSLALWLTEIVSLHQVDRLLYRSVGSLMCVSFLWLGASSLVSVGILLEARRLSRIH